LSRFPFAPGGGRLSVDAHCQRAVAGGVTASPATAARRRSRSWPGAASAGEIPCSRRSITLLEVVETETFPAEEVEIFAKALV
jgi:hypothetical protein